MKRFVPLQQGISYLWYQTSVMKSVTFSLLALASFFACVAQPPVPASGKIIRHSSFFSRFVEARHIDVWLPEGYSKDEKYPVLYLHDGQMLFDSSQTWNHQEWQVDETLSALIASEQIRPCIVVGIWNTPLRWREYYPEKAFDLLEPGTQESLLKSFNPAADRPLSDSYLAFIVNELKPFIDKEYSTSVKPRNTFIGGSSMGGLISIYALCEYPTVFGGAICMSTHWPGGPVENYSMAVPESFTRYLQSKLPSSTGHRVYFDFGTETIDKNYEPHQRAVDVVMRERGYTAANWVTLRSKGDEHNERAWARRLSKPLLFLLAKKPDKTEY
jgi:pimeloyl-ACP methyl ester carboxylesterase